MPYDRQGKWKPMLPAWVVVLEAIGIALLILAISYGLMWLIVGLFIV